MCGKKMTLTFFDFYIVYIKKLGKLFFHTYLLTYLNKDTSVLLKVKITIQKMLKIRITHHQMPNGIYGCILPHTCRKSPKRI